MLPVVIPGEHAQNGINWVHKERITPRVVTTSRTFRPKADKAVRTRRERSA